MTFTGWFIIGSILFVTVMVGIGLAFTIRFGLHVHAKTVEIKTEHIKYKGDLDSEFEELSALAEDVKTKSRQHKHAIKKMERKCSSQPPKQQE